MYFLLPPSDGKKHQVSAKRTGRDRWFVRLHQCTIEPVFPMCNLSCLAKQIWGGGSKQKTALSTHLSHLFTVRSCKLRTMGTHGMLEIGLSTPAPTKLKVGLAEQPYAPCQILLVTHTHIHTHTHTQSYLEELRLISCF